MSWVEPGEKMAGLKRFPSADMTASAPVASRQFWISEWKRMFPFANTGTETASFTARIFSQSANPLRRDSDELLLLWGKGPE